MSNYKPFPLETPSNKRWTISPAPVKPRPEPQYRELLSGRSMRNSEGGARPLGVRDGLLASTADKFERKRLTASQLKAAHLKYLVDLGWKRARIMAYLDCNSGFYSSVNGLLTHRNIAAQKPPGFSPEGDARTNLDCLMVKQNQPADCNPLLKEPVGAVLPDAIDAEKAAQVALDEGIDYFSAQGALARYRLEREGRIE